jgi:hypothetical protein
LTIELKKRFIDDLKEGKAPLRVISHNANVHGGFTISVIDPIRGAPYNGLVDRIVLKSSEDYDAVSGEQRAIQKMRSALPDSPHFASVVGLFDAEIPASPDGLHHLLLDRVHGPSVDTLIQSADTDSRLAILKRMAGFTAQTHAYMGARESSATNPLEEFDKYAQRLQQLNGKTVTIPKLDEVLTELRDSITFIYEKLSSGPAYFRKDPNPQNWLLDLGARSPQIVAIDWEVGRGDCPPEYELSKLLSQGSHIPHTEDGDRVRTLVIDQYLAAFSEASGIPSRADKEKFAYGTALADIPKSFAFLSFAFDKPERYGTAIEYLKNASHGVHRIVDRREFNGIHSEAFNPNLQTIRTIYAQFATILSGASHARSPEYTSKS